MVIAQESKFEPIKKNSMPKSELIQAIEMLLMAETEAQELCAELATATDNGFANELLNELSDQKRKNAWKFLRLLHSMER